MKQITQKFNLPVLLKAVGTTIPDEKLKAARLIIKKRLDKKRAELVTKRSMETHAKIQNLSLMLKQLHLNEANYAVSRKKGADHERHLQFFRTTLKKSAGLTPRAKTAVAGIMNQRHSKAIPVQFIIECYKPVKKKEVINRICEALRIDEKGFKDVGGSLTPVFKTFKTKIYYELIFALPAYEIKGVEFKISSALRELGKFKRVSPGVAEKVKEKIKRSKVLVYTPLKYTRDKCCCCCSPDSDVVTPGKTIDDRPIFENVPADTEWHLKQTRVFEAWELTPPDGGKKKGEGIVVGHPDTGWRKHREYKPGKENILVDKVFDVFTGKHGNAVPEQPTFPQIIPWLPTHGIGTGAFLISTRKKNPKTQIDQVPNAADVAVVSNQVDLSGVAPQASLIPIRCNDGPVVLGGSNEQKAIEYAISQNVHVISISWGGIPDPSLKAIIEHAIFDKNIIVVAAAGQVVDFLSPGNSVIEPAAYTHVIAVAGTNQQAIPWNGSHRGPNVDISAPAQNVWFANFEQTGAEKIVYGEGTSFAAPQVAGIAALWLAFHGRDTLIGKYKHKPLSHVYRYIIRKTAWKPTKDWDTENWGTGIIDAYAVLKEPLPDEADVPNPENEKPSTFSAVTDVKGMIDGWLRDLERGWNDLMGGLGDVGALIQANKDVQYWEEQAAGAWAAAAGFVGDAAKAMNDFGDAAAQKAEEALDAGEDALQELGEKAEETVEAIGDAAEDAGEKIEDGTEAFVGFVTGFF